MIWLRELKEAVGVCIAVAVSAPLAWWAAERSVPAVFHDREIVTPMVKLNSYIGRRITVTRLRWCKIDASASIRDAQGVKWTIEIPPEVNPGPLHVKDTFVSFISVPHSASPGPATLRVALQYECNPLHRFWPIFMIQPDLHFTIIP